MESSSNSVHFSPTTIRSLKKLFISIQFTRILTVTGICKYLSTLMEYKLKNASRTFQINLENLEVKKSSCAKFLIKLREHKDRQPE